MSFFRGIPLRRLTREHELGIFMAVALALSFIPNAIAYLQSGVFSLVKTIDIFWLATIIYALELKKVMRSKQMGDQASDPLTELASVFLPWKVTLRTLVWLLLIPYVIFLVPEVFLRGFESQLTVDQYSRVVVGLGLYIGLASGVAYLLGWGAPFRIKREDASVSILTNTFSVASILSVFFVVILFSLTPSDIWKYYAPKEFSALDVATIFNTFTRHLLEVSAVSLGLSFFVAGKLFSVISDEHNRRELFALGFIFSILMGASLGYIIGPALYFVVIEIPFIVGSMIGIGMFVHLLASSRQGESKST